MASRIHALIDAEGRSIQFKLTEGQARDGRSAAAVLKTVEAGSGQHPARRPRLRQ